MLPCRLVVFLVWTAFTVAPSQGLEASYAATQDAWKTYRFGEFTKAIGLFRKLQANGTGDQESQIQGLYGEASCWNFRRDGRDPARAIALYETLTRLAPEHPLASWASLDAVRARHLGIVDRFAESEKMADAYQGVWEKYPSTQAGEEAFLFSCSLRLPAPDKEEAGKLVQSIQAFLRQRPESVYRSQLYLMLAECAGTQGRPEERLKYLIMALRTREFDPANPNTITAQLYWTIAYVAEFEVGDFATAREYHRRLLDEYPKDLRAFSVRQALKRMDAVENAIREGRPVPPGPAGEITE